jgi:hypothetical protein
MIDSIQPAAEIIAELVAEAQSVMRGLCPQAGL